MLRILMVWRSTLHFELKSRTSSVIRYYLTWHMRKIVWFEVSNEHRFNLLVKSQKSSDSIYILEQKLKPIYFDNGILPGCRLQQCSGRIRNCCPKWFGSRSNGYFIRSPDLDTISILFNQVIQLSRDDTSVRCCWYPASWLVHLPEVHFHGEINIMISSE